MTTLTQTLINDPRHDRKIDVTGWELDRLAEVLAGLRHDIAAGADRAVTEAEWDAITGYPGLPDSRADYYLDDSYVDEVVDYLSDLVDEAIYQRDISSAFEAKEIGRKLTFREEMAWDRYIADIASDEQI